MTMTPPLDDQAARTQRHLACLDTLIAHGMDLANRVHQQATGPTEPSAALATPGAALATPGAAPTPSPISLETIALFERISLTVRRAILVSRKLAEPLPRAPATPAPDRPSVDRTAARKRIIREVEDTIHRKAGAAEAESLEAELCERVETCDFDDDIGNRPIHEIIADICRDLGVSTDFPANHSKRRTPQELRTLTARAAAPRPPDPASQGPGRSEHGPGAPTLKPPPLSDPARERPRVTEHRTGT